MNEDAPTQPDRLAPLPNALRARSILRRLADNGVPALLAHPDPDWNRPGSEPTPRPFVLWMHGRTVSKELDPGRYLRWQRAGIATCAIDLPGHGERADPSLQDAGHTLQIAEQCADEIDRVLGALSAPEFNGAFDLSRAAIGGMSAGGMVALIRLCSRHRFIAAAVEATAGDFNAMRSTRKSQDDGSGGFFVSGLADRLNPINHLDGWRPIPFLALHSDTDEWIPVAAIQRFAEALRVRYIGAGVDPGMVTLHTWPKTGAPFEHYGFGKVANEAKNLQTEFLVRHLNPTPPVESGGPSPGPTPH